MPLNESDWVKEYYMDGLETTVEETQEQQQENVATEQVQEEVKTEQVQEQQIEQKQEQVETAAVEYKSNKKYIPIDDEEKLYQQLSQKYGSKSLSDEQKALQYLRDKNPELDENEIQFLAEENYGIGVDDIEEINLTPEQITALRKQGIDRKKLFSEANSYFNDKASQVQLEAQDPFELDDNYKQYIADVKQRQELAQQQEQRLTQIKNDIETSAKNISEVRESYEIDIDESKFATDVNFKLSAEKQTQLIDFANRYSPTNDEVKQFTDPQTGKFDYKGYLSYLSPMAFAREYVKAGIKQGITTNREKFINEELKNSTLRPGEASVVADTKFDFNDWYWSNVAGR